MSLIIESLFNFTFFYGLIISTKLLFNLFGDWFWYSISFEDWGTLKVKIFQDVFSQNKIGGVKLK